MGILEEILKNKEELLIKLLEILEGKESKTKINLDGVEFHIGNSAVRMKGEIEFVFIPVDKKE